jgi:pyrophosphatase PpaX
MTATGFDPVIFDLDGTVVDTVELIRDSFRYTVKTVLGDELPDSVMLAGVGQPLMPQMQALSLEHAEELYNVYREYNHRRHDELIKPYAGMRAALMALRAAGRRLGIVRGSVGRRPGRSLSATRRPTSSPAPLRA